jgi:hypothetical protein
MRQTIHDPRPLIKPRSVRVDRTGRKGAGAAKALDACLRVDRATERSLGLCPTSQANKARERRRSDELTGALCFVAVNPLIYVHRSGAVAGTP